MRNGVSESGVRENGERVERVWSESGEWLRYKRRERERERGGLKTEEYKKYATDRERAEQQSDQSTIRNSPNGTCTNWSM